MPYDSAWAFLTTTINNPVVPTAGDARPVAVIVFPEIAFIVPPINKVLTVDPDGVPYQIRSPIEIDVLNSILAANVKVLVVPEPVTAEAIIPTPIVDRFLKLGVVTRPESCLMFEKYIPSFNTY